MISNLTYSNLLNFDKTEAFDRGREQREDQIQMTFHTSAAEALSFGDFRERKTEAVKSTCDLSVEDFKTPEVMTFFGRQQHRE